MCSREKLAEQHLKGDGPLALCQTNFPSVRSWAGSSQFDCNETFPLLHSAKYGVYMPEAPVVNLENGVLSVCVSRSLESDLFLRIKKELLLFRSFLFSSSSCCSQRQEVVI